jgi:rhodanese-related sulfurtransferase
VKHSPGFLKLVDDARSRVREISPEEVRRKQERGEPFEFIDVREDNEWQQGRAAGARHIGRGILERDVEEAVPDRDREIVLYCGGGYRSALSADNLQRMGYHSVWSMSGGIRRWRELDFPEEK